MIRKPHHSISVKTLYSLRCLALCLAAPGLFIAPSFASPHPVHLELATGVPGQAVSIATNFNRWEKRPMTEKTPGHYIYSFEEPWLPEVQYKFVVDGRWMADPANPAGTPDGHGGRNSVLTPKDFHEDPLLTPEPGAPIWKEFQLKLVDLENSPRTVTVLSPPSDKTHSVTVYFQDGGDYLNRTGIRALLSNLSRQPGMPPMTGVFIPPQSREHEYWLYPPYADWVAGPVVSAIEARFNTGGDRTQRLLIGPSLGGLATLYTALRHREIFANAASQSGSLWVDESVLLKTLALPVTSAADRLNIFMDCGTYETSEMLKFNRLGFEAARDAGHEIVYREYPSTHEWIGWRNRLTETFRYFFSLRISPTPDQTLSLRHYKVFQTER